MSAATLPELPDDHDIRFALIREISKEMCDGPITPDWQFAMAIKCLAEGSMTCDEALKRLGWEIEYPDEREDVNNENHPER